MRELKFGVMHGTGFSLLNFPVTLFSDVAMASKQLGFDGYFVNDHINLLWRDETWHPQIQAAYTLYPMKGRHSVLGHRLRGREGA